MTARNWDSLKAHAAHLQRMSVVFAVELRLKIVTELYMREMSAKQFFEEFGGGSISRVMRNFERLAEAGWLQYVRSEGPGGSRRGGVEHFYRATEPAFFDPETWALLPYSIRVAFSWNTFKQIAWRLRAAIEAGRLQARQAESLTFTSLLVDRVGWENVIEAVGTHFALLSAEQKDGALRISRSEEKPVRRSVVHIAFEAPASDDRTAAPGVVESREEPFVPVPVRLSKVFADEVSMQIVAEANRRAISAKEFHAEIGRASAGGIRRRFRRLADIGLLQEVNGETGGTRRGATEKFYRAVAPAIFRDRNGPWAKVPDALRGSDAWQTFEQLSALVKEAMQAGTFDARDDGCLAWSLLQLDEQGWEAVIAKLDELRRFVLQEQDRASDRMKRSGEEPVAMTVAFAAFESPKEAEREP